MRVCVSVHAWCLFTQTSRRTGIVANGQQQIKEGIITTMTDGGPDEHLPSQQPAAGGAGGAVRPQHGPGVSSRDRAVQRACRHDCGHACSDMSTDSLRIIRLQAHLLVQQPAAGDTGGAVRPQHGPVVSSRARAMQSACDTIVSMHARTRLLTRVIPSLAPAYRLISLHSNQLQAVPAGLLDHNTALT